MRAGRNPGGAGGRVHVTTAAYVAAWLVGAAVLAAVAVLVLDDGEPEEVSLPPIQETELAEAARRAGCDLRRAARGERLDPVVDGPAASEPAAAGFYEEALEAGSLVAALRRGVVVIHFRSELEGDLVDDLRRVQESAPTGTIVTANSTMPFEVAATAHRRLLGCPHASDEAIEAALLFRGRFVGSGPGG